MVLLGLSPDYKTSAAGILLIMGLSIWIESPVIDLLSTSTTLGTSRERWVALSKWTWIMMATVCSVHALVAFTPLFDMVTGQVMGVERDITNASRLAFQIMTPWSALVGWRRYLHGIMIKHGHTKPVSYGTVSRLVALCSVGFVLLRFTGIHGLTAVGIAMVAAIFTETMFIHFASRPTIKRLPSRPEERISIRELASFHLPLTASTLVMLSSPVLVTRSLARGEDQKTNLAAWQTAFTVMWMFRSVTFALPEAVISLYSPGHGERVLKKFCLTMGVGLSGIMVLAHLVNLDGFCFTHFFNASTETSQIARQAFLACSILPLASAMMAYYRGVLTAHHVTVARLTAIAASIAALFIGLEAAILAGVVGVLVPSIGLTVAQFVENVTLSSLLRKFVAKNPGRFEPLTGHVSETPIDLSGAGARQPLAAAITDSDD